MQPACLFLNNFKLKPSSEAIVNLNNAIVNNVPIIRHFKLVFLEST